MPRFVIQTAVECLYTFHSKADPKSDAGETKISPPVFFPTGWLVELGNQSSFAWATKDDPDRRVPAQTVFMHRPVIIEAKSLAAAETKSESSWDRWHSDSPAYFSLNGWHLRETRFSVRSIRQISSDRKLRRNFEVNCKKLVAPDIGKHQLSVDQQFELLRWMWVTAKNYEVDAPYQPLSVRRLLLGTLYDWQHTTPWITSHLALHQMLANGILGQGQAIFEMWRQDHGFSYDATTSIPVSHYGKGGRDITNRHADLTIDDAIWTAMRDVPGHSLGTSPNHMHPEATVIHSFGVCVHDNGFSFEIAFGYKIEALGSSWRQTLAATRGDETFYETADRAMDILHRIVPDYRAKFRRDIRHAA